MKLRNLIFLPVMLTATGLAGTVVYTDNKHILRYCFGPLGFAERFFLNLTLPLALRSTGTIRILTMATIRDELAASIQKCFDRTYVDLANQQQFLFGAGNVTITKPDGTKAMVKSWAQFLSEYASVNRLSTRH
jgi:hypothetical protein